MAMAKAKSGNALVWAFEEPNANGRPLAGTLGPRVFKRERQNIGSA